MVKHINGSPRFGRLSVIKIVRFPKTKLHVFWLCCKQLQIQLKTWQCRQETQQRTIALPAGRAPHVVILARVGDVAESRRAVALEHGDGARRVRPVDGVARAQVRQVLGRDVRESSAGRRHHCRSRNGGICTSGMVGLRLGRGLTQHQKFDHNETKNTKDKQGRFPASRPCWWRSPVPNNWQRGKWQRHRD